MDSHGQESVIQIHMMPAWGQEEMMGAEEGVIQLTLLRGEVKEVEEVAAAALSWLYISFGQSLAV